MADDKKNTPDVAPPTEASAPTAEVAAVPEPLAPNPVPTDAEAVMLEHEGQAALFEMGEAVPDHVDAVIHTEMEGPTAPDAPKAEKEQEQPSTPGKDDPTLAHSGQVVDFAAARDEAAKEEKKAVKQKPPTEKDKPAKPGRGRLPKDGKVAADKAKQPKPQYGRLPFIDVAYSVQSHLFFVVGHCSIHSRYSACVLCPVSSFFLSSYHSFKYLLTFSNSSNSSIIHTRTLPSHPCSQSNQINKRIMSSGVSAFTKKFSSRTFNALAISLARLSFGVRNPDSY